MGANPTVISNWFSLLEEIKTKFRILSPCQIWSDDETGIENVPKEVKVLDVKNSNIPKSKWGASGNINGFDFC